MGRPSPPLVVVHKDCQRVAKKKTSHTPYHITCNLDKELSLERHKSETWSWSISCTQQSRQGVQRALFAITLFAEERWDEGGGGRGGQKDQHVDLSFCLHCHEWCKSLHGTMCSLDHDTKPLNKGPFIQQKIMVPFLKVPFSNKAWNTAVA